MAIEVTERQVFDWNDMSEQARAELRMRVKAEAAQMLRVLPRMIAAKVAVEIIAESIGAAPPRQAMSALGTLSSDLAVKTFEAFHRKLEGGGHG